VLLHSCCAPCSGPVIERMYEEGLDLTIFFYNPNIHPKREYEIRKEENIRYAHTSPVGKSLALEISHPTLATTLMIRDLSTGRQEMLFPHDSTLSRVFPIWSPSGQSIAFLEFAGGFTNPSAKIIHLAGGRRIQNLGRGVLFQWLSDSTVLIARDTSNGERPNFNVSRKVNLTTGKEEPLRGHPDVAIPVLNNTKYFLDGENGARLLTRQEFEMHPRPAGVLIVSDRGWSSRSDNFFYYSTSGNTDVWKFNFRSLRRSKIIGLPSGYRYNFGQADYADEVITYSRSRLKTNIVKVDKVFVENQ